MKEAGIEETFICKSNRHAELRGKYGPARQIAYTHVTIMEMGTVINELLDEIEAKSALLANERCAGKSFSRWVDREFDRLDAEIERLKRE